MNLVNWLCDSYLCNHAENNLHANFCCVHDENTYIEDLSFTRVSLASLAILPHGPAMYEYIRFDVREA